MAGVVCFLYALSNQLTPKLPPFLWLSLLLFFFKFCLKRSCLRPFRLSSWLAWSHDVRARARPREMFDQRMNFDSGTDGRVSGPEQRPAACQMSYLIWTQLTIRDRCWPKARQPKLGWAREDRDVGSLTPKEGIKARKERSLSAHPSARTT